MDYKSDLSKDMNGAKFEIFVHKVLAKVKKRHDKVACIIDNASYHNIYREEIPRPSWPVKKLKEFCELKKLEVTAKHSKNSKKSGVIVKEDYVEVIKKYVADSDCKYRVDEIMKSYDVIPLRLPPYHPELNAIGKYLFAIQKVLNK